jgi:hypothetical protein
MAKKKSNQLTIVESGMSILPPTSGRVGAFLESTEKQFKSRGKKMDDLLKRINASGARTEAMLQTAAGMMEAAEASLERQFRGQGLLPDPSGDNGDH